MTPLRRAARIAIPASLVLLGALPASAQDDLEGRIQAYLESAVRKLQFRGAVLVARDGKVVFKKGFGLASEELGVPNVPGTKFRLGSLTKQFTALAVLILENRGKLKVEDRISKHLDECPAAWKEITIHHLLTHTSGIPSFTSFPDYEQTMVLPTTVREGIARFREKPLQFRPGARFEYSNSGYFLLGQIIEKASGQTYEAYLADQVFRPLGMAGTGYDHQRSILKDRAAGYSLVRGELLNASYLDMSIPFSAGALYSSVEDLFLWDRALDGEGLVPRKSLEKMFKPYQDGYGYGIGISRKFGRRELSHGGGINGFATHFARYPGDRACVIVLSNLESAPAGRISDALAAILFGKPYDEPGGR